MASDLSADRDIYAIASDLSADRDIPSDLDVYPDIASDLSADPDIAREQRAGEAAQAGARAPAAGPAPATATASASAPAHVPVVCALPLTVVGGSHVATAATAALAAAVGRAALLRFTSRFYEMAFRDPLLSSFIRDQEEPHAQVRQLHPRRPSLQPVTAPNARAAVRGLGIREDGRRRRVDR